MEKAPARHLLVASIHKLDGHRLPGDGAAGEPVQLRFVDEQLDVDVVQTGNNFYFNLCSFYSFCPLVFSISVFAFQLLAFSLCPLAFAFYK